MNWELLWIVAGMLLIVEGLPYFLAPDKAVRTLKQLETLGPDRLRLLGLLAIIAGTVLLLVARSK